MMIKKFRFATAAVAVVAMLATACGSETVEGAGSVDEGDASEDTSGEEVAAEGAYIFLPKSLNNPYWVDAREGMEAKAAELGVKAEFLGPDNDDAARQVAIFESILATNPAGIAVSPNDPASVRDVIARARAQGIPVIAWDGPVPDSEVMGYIGTDNVAAGASEGEALAEAIGGEGKVAIVIGNLAATNLNQRLEGLKAALEDYPDIEIVATEESGESVATAQSQAETILQAHPDLAGFAGIGGSDLPGIVGALTSANLCGQVKAVGFDVVPQGIEGMQNGCVDAMVSQRPFGMTADALQILVDFHNDTSDLGDDFNVDTGVVIVTPETLEDFLSGGPQ
jgi:ribose transport system substrate-binding protein